MRVIPKEKLCVRENISIRQALQKMDAAGMGFVSIVDARKRMVGIITDGDFRRAVFNGIDLTSSVMKIANQNFFSLEKHYQEQDVRKIFQRAPIEVLPVLEEGKISNFLYRENFIQSHSNGKKNHTRVGLLVVIMAGGKGTRLDPFTRIVPKPLMPLGEKAVIERIMDRFAEFGMEEFYLSLNHKSKIIRAYFEELKSTYSVRFLEEEKPLGTAGALKMLEGKMKQPFFVTNCDVLIKCDYSQIYRFHKKHHYDLTLVGSMQHIRVPYGVCHLESHGNLKSIVEKPKYDFLVNTGMYLLNPEVLKSIPANKSFLMTDLIKKLRREGKRIGVFPISEGSWIDIGQMDEYKKNLELLK